MEQNLRTATLPETQTCHYREIPPVLTETKANCIYAECNVLKPQSLQNNIHMSKDGVSIEKPTAVNEAQRENLQFIVTVTKALLG